MKRVLITGSRGWDKPQEIYDTLDNLWDEIGPFILVHGAAHGADRISAYHQIRRQRPVEAHPAEWGHHWPDCPEYHLSQPTCKRSGFIRNAHMVSLGADVCLAFIKDQSRGATMCAKLAEDAGIEVRRFIS